MLGTMKVVLDTSIIRQDILLRSPEDVCFAKWLERNLMWHSNVAILSERLDHEIEADQKYIEILKPYKRLE